MMALCAVVPQLACSSTIEDPVLQPVVDQALRRNPPVGGRPERDPEGKLVLVEKASGKIHVWQGRLPDRLRARAPEEVDRVVLLSERTSESGSVGSYFVSCGGPSGVRKTHMLDIEVISRATGGLIRTTTISGHMPSRGRAKVVRSSSRPGVEEVVQWLEQG